MPSSMSSPNCGSSVNSSRVVQTPASKQADLRKLLKNALRQAKAVAYAKTNGDGDIPDSFVLAGQSLAEHVACQYPTYADAGVALATTILAEINEA